MKIAIIHHQFADKGGMETYLFDLIKGFGAVNDLVDVITFKYDQNIPIPSYCTLKKKFIFLPKMLRKFYFMRNINKHFHKSDYDISLSFTRTSSQDMVICGGTHKGFLKSVSKTPLIKDFLELYFEKKCYLETPHIMAHSNLVKIELESLYQIDPEKIHLLYPPINTEKFNSSTRIHRNDNINSFGIDKTKTTLLFPSTGHKRKGWFELIEAFKQLPTDEFELLIAGNKTNTFANYSNIKSLGFVKDMPALYSACDFTILPSYYEPFGLVIIESLQCGTPVIISDMVGAKDFVTEKEGIIIKDINAQNIISAIYKARDTKFNIDSNFAQSHNLTIDYHISKIKEICKKNER